MTVGNLAREEVFKLRDTSEPFQNTENSPVPLYPHFTILCMRWSLKLIISMSDLEE